MVEQWSRNLEVPGSKPNRGINLYYRKFLREDLEPLIPWLFT